MTDHDVDVVVVGAGIMGSSAAWHLAREGRRVALLEQFDLDHPRGSSHGASRIFRLAYDIPDYVELARAALPLWREAEQELGEELLWTTGGLDIGRPEHLEGLMQALSGAGVAYEQVGHDEVERRWPWFRLPPGWEAVYQADAGVLRAERCRAAMQEMAQRAGAEVRGNTRVDRIEPGGSGVVVEAADDRWRAEQVVLATAGWTNHLLASLGAHVPLTVTREQVVYFDCGGDPPLSFICHGGVNSFDFYGLPNWRGGPLKVGKHMSGPEVDPDSEAADHAGLLAEITDFARQYLPLCASEPAKTDTCLYASTPDDDFVLDRIGPVVLGIGFGGHGFKFGAIVGRMLADLVLGETIQFSSRFSHSRFGAVAASER